MAHDSGDVAQDPDHPLPDDNVIPLSSIIEKKRQPLKCLHDSLEVDEANRVVTCRNCKREVDPFLALVRIADRASAFQAQWGVMRRDYKNLAGYVPHLRAVRALEGMWRGRLLPMCPHCKTGVTAESLASMDWVHQTYAERVRMQTEETSTVSDVVTIRE